MIQKIAELFSRYRTNPWIRRADSALLTIHKGYENLNYDIQTNGELSALKRLGARSDIKTVFDVGANRGDWADLALKTFPCAHVHAFEIVPETFGHLHARFANSTNVSANGFGLSDAEGAINVYFSSEKHGIATCVEGFSEAFHKYTPKSQAVSVITGDRYCHENKIESIDFLKIDVEGLEPKVLQGFNGMLRSEKIEIIQFEYGYLNIDTHFLLKDFYEYLSKFNMAIGKIYPTHVDFRPYQHSHEDFLGPNYLAVRSDRDDLLALLGGEE